MYASHRPLPGNGTCAHNSRKPCLSFSLHSPAGCSRDPVWPCETPPYRWRPPSYFSSNTGNLASLIKRNLFKITHSATARTHVLNCTLSSGLAFVDVSRRWTKLRSAAFFTYKSRHTSWVYECVECWGNVRVHGLSIRDVTNVNGVVWWCVQVRKAVLALQKYHSTRAKEKRKLIQENPLVSLIIGLKKIPNKSFKPHRM